jgi:hypothetical protein
LYLTIRKRCSAIYARRRCRDCFPIRQMSSAAISLCIPNTAISRFSCRTGSGKTLVGLLIAEWRRRKYTERVVYLCPTRQLVNQVASQARAKYGIDLHAFTGSRAQYDAHASADWQNAEAIAVTTYSSLFNTNPFFEDAHLIILDDAHSAENYVSAFWSLLIEKSNAEHEAAFTALAGVVSRFLPPSDKSRLTGQSKSAADRQWVEKLPTPVFQAVVPEVISLLDEHTKASALRHSWSLLRDSLHACHLYISRRAILIRPLIPPSGTHKPFAGAKQRVYMSATLGAGGDLERSPAGNRSTKYQCRWAGTSRGSGGGSSFCQNDLLTTRKRNGSQWRRSSSAAVPFI